MAVAGGGGDHGKARLAVSGDDLGAASKTDPTATRGEADGAGSVPTGGGPGRTSPADAAATDGLEADEAADGTQQAAGAYDPPALTPDLSASGVGLDEWRPHGWLGAALVLAGLLSGRRPGRPDKAPTN